MNNLKDELRPYVDAEIPQAMKRLAEDPLFVPAARYVFPSLSAELAREKLLEISTVKDFQMTWMYSFNKRVIDSTIDVFSSSCDVEPEPGKGYLYFSNHRDIILDSSLLQMILVEKGLPTSAITYGNNLVVNQFAADIARSNKMYKVVRDTNRKELLLHSRLLSEFLHGSVSKGQSCWIAQRSGRTKDGRDTTNPALVKMLSLNTRVSTVASLVDSYEALHLLPVSVSYQYESCDFLKAQEQYHKTQTANYMKSTNEDMASMLCGITQWKGNVHIHLGTPVAKDTLWRLVREVGRSQGSVPDAVEPDAPVNSAFFNTFCQLLSEELDAQIHRNFKLFPYNYVAHDLRSGSRRYGDFYTPVQKEVFSKRMDAGTPLSGKLSAPAKACFLDIYANPVDSCGL